MSKTEKEKTINEQNDEIQISLYEKVKNFKSYLGMFIEEEDLNFYYDVDDELLELMVKVELLDYEMEDDGLNTDLEKRTKYSTNTRIALFFGFLEDLVGLYGEYNQKGYPFSVEEFEDIVKGILFEEDLEKFIKIDVLNQLLERKE